MEYEQRTIRLKDLRLNTGQIPDVPKNPRFIKDERFEALKRSIKDDPEMLNLRELVAYDNGGELVVIMGNMRFRAMKELGMKDAPVKVLPHDTSAKKLRAYIQKDNIAFGQNDWDLMANEWDLGELEDFGLECDFLGNDEEESEAEQDKPNYTQKIEIPTYEMKGDEPKVSELVDTSAVNDLLADIERADITPEQKEFLRVCAYRHAVIDFEKVAEYYAHQPKQVQELMEDNALVIVDFDKALERGFVEMSPSCSAYFPSSTKE